MKHNKTLATARPGEISAALPHADCANVGQGLSCAALGICKEGVPCQASMSLELVNYPQEENPLLFSGSSMFSFLVLIVVQLVFALDSEESHPSAIEKLGTFKELLK